MIPPPSAGSAKQSVNRRAGRCALIEDASVLIVDRSTEARGVLRTALERLGLRVLEATGADDGVALARKHRPDLVLLDLDAAQRSLSSVVAEFTAYVADRNATLLILGPARLRACVTGGEFVAKPYHYQPLVRKIEQLLCASRCNAHAPA
jgi:DNA-binding response OmpR family regulator